MSLGQGEWLFLTQLLNSPHSESLSFFSTFSLNRLLFSTLGKSLLIDVLFSWGFGKLWFIIS